MTASVCVRAGCLLLLTVSNGAWCTTTAPTPPALLARQTPASAPVIASATLMPPVVSAPKREVQTQTARSEASSSGNADWFARLIGVVGVGLSAWFGFYKMRRDRRLSIEDDFWLRKVVSPTAIEPMLKTIVDLLASLPSTNASAEDQRAYASRVTEQVQRLMGGVQMLALLDAELTGYMLKGLADCEDSLTGYCQKLSQGETVDINELNTSIWDAVNRALSPIKSWQEKR